MVSRGDHSLAFPRVKPYPAGMSELVPVVPESEDKKALEVKDINDPTIRAAMAYRLEGNTWQACADHLAELGFRGAKGGKLNVVDLWRKCKPYEMMIQQDRAFEALKRSTLSTAQEAVSQVNGALVAGEIPKQSLPVVAGIMVDKFARLAAIEKAPEIQQSPLMAMLQELQRTGGTLKLEVTQPKTIDVEVVE